MTYCFGAVEDQCWLSNLSSNGITSLPKHQDKRSASAAPKKEKNEWLLIVCTSCRYTHRLTKASDNNVNYRFAFVQAPAWRLETQGLHPLSLASLGTIICEVTQQSPFKSRQATDDSLQNKNKNNRKEKRHDIFSPPWSSTSSSDLSK